MKRTNSNINHNEFLKKINTSLLIILFLMIACFFTWSENIIITRSIKVVGRMGVLLASYLVYRKIINYGAVDSFKIKNPMALMLYLAYLLLGFASFLWTSNIRVSALQWFMTMQTLVFCFFFIKSFYLLDEYFKNHTIRLYSLLGNAIFGLILIFIIGMWLAPDVFFRATHGGEEYRLGGYLMNPNELGMLILVGGSGFIFEIYRKNYSVWTVIKLLVLCYALYATGSRSSLIGAFLITCFFLKQSSNIRLKLIVITAMLLVMPVAVNKIILKEGDRDRLEEVMTMTGRLPFWKALVTEGLPREPLLGFGFMRIDYKDYFQSTHTYAGKMTHNTFIQVLMNLGFIGLTIVIFQMIFTLIGISKENREKKIMLYSLLIPIIINSFTEFGIFGESNFGILFYQMIIIYITYKQNTILTPSEKVYLFKRRPDLLKTI